MVEVEHDCMYLINAEGRVFSKFTNKYLKSSESMTGYLVVNIRKGGKRQPYYIHRMVAEAFIPNTENKPQVNHIDGDKHNNRVSNLEWASDSENKQHAVLTNLIKRGSDLKRARYTDAQVSEICTLFEAGLSVDEVMQKVSFEVTRPTLLNIRSRRDWKHISRNFQWDSKIKYRNKRAKCND